MIGFIRNVLSSGPGKQKYDEKRTAMLNDIVLRRVFRFLDLESLKNCRLVCNKWANISEPFFIKNAAICLINTRDKCKNNSISKILKQRKFPSKDILQCSFESFKFIGVTPLSDLDDLLMKRNYRVKELTIIGLILTDENGERIYYSHERMGGKFYRYNLTDIIVPNSITKLHLDCPNSYYTRLEISLNRLVSVQYLVLKGCTVIVNGRIAPKEMELYDVFFSFQDGGKIEPCPVLNEFLYFHQIKKLRLDNNVIEEDGNPDGKLFGVHTILDLKDCNVTVDTLELDGTRILDWETANWNINKLVLSKESPFLHRNTIKAREVQILGCSDVDLAFLPKTIERLTLGSLRVQVLCTDQINYTKLSYLSLVGCIEHLTHFKNCCNLVDIELLSLEGQELNLNLVPLSAKRIYLKGNVQVAGSGAFELEKLILKDYRWEEIENISNTLQAKILVICMTDPSKIIEVDKNTFTKFVENPFVGSTENDLVCNVIKNLLFKPYERIAVGGCTWRNEKNINTNRFYLFETQKGKGRLLPDVEFEDLMSSTLSKI